jgi:hypothetical protein
MVKWKNDDFYGFNDFNDLNGLTNRPIDHLTN